jgi:Zn-dependent protease
MVSIAGILANLTIALVSLIIIKALIYSRLFEPGRALSGIEEPVSLLLFRTLLLNVGLAFFNLLPIPPLDGSKVLWTVLPDSMKPALDALERFGFIILLLLMQMGVLNALFTPVWVVVGFLLAL